MKVVRHIFLFLVWTVVSIYFAIFLLPRLPFVQSALAEMMQDAITQKIGTRANVVRVDVRFPDRLVADEVTLFDQKGKEMLRAGRVSVSVELLPLLERRIVINSAQLFGSRVTLYQQDGNAPLNCQYAIDSLTKKKEDSQHTPLDLTIHSLIIRNCKLTYDRWDKPEQEGVFSPYHLHLSDISSHIALNYITDDTISVSLKELRLEEASGIKVNEMSFKADYAKALGGDGQQHSVNLSSFLLRMPQTKVQIPQLVTRFSTAPDGKIKPGTISINADIDAPYADATDFMSLLSGGLPELLPVLTLKGSVNGTDELSNVTLAIHTTDNDEMAIMSAMELHDALTAPEANILVSQCHISEGLMRAMSDKASLPQILGNVGSIDTKGRIEAKLHDYVKRPPVMLSAELTASKLGFVSIAGSYVGNTIKADVKTDGVDLSKIANQSKLGKLTCRTSLEVQLDDNDKLSSVKMSDGKIDEIVYASETYHDINVDGTYRRDSRGNDAAVGSITMRDPRLAFDSEFDISHLNINDLTGSIEVNNLMTDFGKPASLQHVSLISHKEDGVRDITLDTDFASMHVNGTIDLRTLHQSFDNLISKYLPSLTGNRHIRPTSNEFTLDARIENLDFLKAFADIPVEMGSPVDISGRVGDVSNTTNIGIDAPSLSIQGLDLDGTQITLWTPQGSLNSSIETYLSQSQGKVRLNLDCTAVNDTLATRIMWDNMREKPFRGDVSLVTRFHTKEEPGDVANFDIAIPKSAIELGDSVWLVHTNAISYKDGRLAVDSLAMENASQALRVNGIFSKEPADSVQVELQNIDVSYILNLVNFHSVDFEGFAYGNVTARALLGDYEARAQLDVQQFKFESGKLGTLHANADYSKAGGKININAVAEDPEANGRALIDGSIGVSPGYLDLDIVADSLRLDFMQKFCQSFLSDVDLRGSGKVRLFGPFNNVDLAGGLKTNGELTINSTHCHYSLPGDSVLFSSGDIHFANALIKDKLGNSAYLNGDIRHRNFGRMTYDLKVNTDRFLAYDIPELGDDSYCGVAIVNGDIDITGRPGELNINADVNTLAGSYITYDASSTATIMSRDFIQWNSASQKEADETSSRPSGITASNSPAPTTNIRMILLINVTPETRLHLLMDSSTGDYIDLYGNASLNATYYNKGSFRLHGNYEVTDGTYHMTIQRLIAKNFRFSPGSTIAFGGDPYEALLQMKAVYALNSVPLSDLNMGSSFKSNNVPVNCIMNISGTPAKPVVDFGLELPSLSTDAQQMVNSVINSEELMNQQVLYLLAIGRFYAGDNADNSSRSDASLQGQTTLALQSFLSGTLSQQFNSIMERVMSQVSKKNTWTFGANVATGNEGMSNAEYEGLLSGKLFNNRLLFDGQFGYRDNVSTNTQSFIGDFTIKYLLTPSGTIALKAYNQANDRYFTRNSLNTQGIGIVFQKEFGK